MEMKLAVAHLKDADGRFDMKQVLRTGVPMPKVVEQLGEAEVVKLMCILIAELCSAFNVVRNMTEEQILDYAVEQVQEVPNYRFEDYVVFFAEAKRGKFGQPFDRLDRGVLDAWLEKYHEQRTHALWEMQDEHKLVAPRPMERTSNTDPLSDKMWDLGIAIEELKKGLNGRV